MPNVMEECAGVLTAQLREYASVSVTYKRGATTVSVSAAVDSAPVLADDGTGALRVIAGSRQYLIPAADLTGISLPPQPGDEVRETQGGVVNVYRVMDQAMMACWTWEDNFASLLRVRTKRVGVE